MLQIQGVRLLAIVVEPAQLLQVDRAGQPDHLELGFASD